MNASRTDQPRTSPVALRTKTARSSNGVPVPGAIVAICGYPSSVEHRLTITARRLAARQNELLDLFSALDVDHRTEQLALFIGAARVDAKGSAESLGPPRLVDVAVQRERRLVALDRVADRGRADRLDGMAGVLEIHLLRQLRSVVKPGAIGRTVQAEDRALGRRG